MRIPTVTHRRELQVNMTPMIDVVFLLIVFFLVSSHLARQESQMPLPLPAAESGETLDDDRPRVVINVLADGQLLLAGRRVSVEQLEERLRLRREQERAADLDVRVRSDRHVPFRFVQPILLAVSRAGLGNVTFAVVRPTAGVRP